MLFNSVCVSILSKGQGKGKEYANRKRSDKLETSFGISNNRNKNHNIRVCLDSKNCLNDDDDV